MRVFLIDDHALFRAGLESLLQRQGIDVVGHSADGVEKLDSLPALEPDIILLDMRLGGTNGHQVLKTLNKAGNRTPVVVLTTSRLPEDLFEALRAGAQGYLLKDMEPSQLVVALRQVLNGETAVAPELTGLLAQAVQGKLPAASDPAKAGSEPPFSDLTPRELEILEHLAAGQSNKLIARQLGISDGTVKLHVKAVLRKLQVHSRVEAAILAVENGLGRSSVLPSPQTDPTAEPQP